MRIEKLVIATRNPSKIEYYRDVLLQLSSTILSLNDLGVEEKPVETGETAEQNAQIKAMFYSNKTNLPVFVKTNPYLPTSYQKIISLGYT